MCRLPKCLTRWEIRNRGIKKSFFIDGPRIAAFFILVTFIIGCAKETIPVGAGIVGIRASINKISISPLAYDGAIVVVEGIATEVSIDEPSDNQTITKFKLANFSGTYINVVLEGEQEIADFNYVVVGGMYDRQKNEIAGNAFEAISSEEEIDKIIKQKKKGR